ncbi:vas2 AP-1 complex subunit sigma-1 [Candida maltosa Xu316]|uniref:AP complex subunit sigma n=1 Tax=Candida maltosa (strain Xu316) TaxID=1245528 RepID=M3IQ04_CANMX|nr:Small subunit of the clathrin-associated adaptor complex AP-1, putative [Candida maltosa Xu316]
MSIKFLFLISRQGKNRLSKWYETISQKEKSKIIRELSTIILSRRAKMCNVLEYKDLKVIYRRYASLFFVIGVDSDDNELIGLEVIHRFVEQMDKLYGNVCELDIIFGFDKAYHILDELLIDGYLQESSKKEVLKRVNQQDELENMDEFENILA